MDCTDVNFWVAILSCSCVRCSHREQMGEVCMERHCTCVLELPVNLSLFENKTVKETKSCALSYSQCIYNANGFFPR